MERLLQYWDDLDDLVGACGLFAERIRRLAIFTLSSALFLGLLFAGVVLTFVEPPLGLAIATILLVSLMLYSVTTPKRGKSTDR
ncbi:MAG TPA: hypothetical protein PKK10_16865 [Woeseiaceae bacterium]|nr:hypothetical protein [Woeseiaceae bacterium]